MTNNLIRAMFPDDTDISVSKELAAFEILLNGSANLYFGEVDHDKMIAGYRKDDRDYLDTHYKHLCALSAYHFKLAKNLASLGEPLGALRALGEAKGHRMAARAEYWGEADLKEQEANRQKSNAKRPRTNPLQRLIIEIVTSNPNIKAETLPDELEKYKGHGVIEDVTEDEISYSNKDRLDSAPISGLQDRLGRAKKKIKSF